MLIKDAIKSLTEHVDGMDVLHAISVILGMVGLCWAAMLFYLLVS